MHKSRRISLSPVSPPSKSSVLTSGTWGTEEYSRPFIDSSVAVVSMASSCQQWSHHGPHVTEPRVRWAQCELARSPRSASCFRLCLTSWFYFHFHGLACSVLIWLLLFFYCIALLWFLDNFFLYLPFPSPAAQRSWPAKKQKHLLMSTFGEILKKRGV